MQTVCYDGMEIIPSKIVCVGRNYVGHIEELGNEVPSQMIVFSKPNSAITDAPAAAGPDDVHYEGEICFLCMKQELAGVAFGLDLTKRELQDKLREKGLPGERAKAFDGSAVFSEFVNFDCAAHELSLELSINDTLVQAAGAAMMIHPPEMILREVTSFMTLNDGDILMTGTPAGVGKLTSGDRLHGSVSHGGNVLASKWWTAT